MATPSTDYPERLPDQLAHRLSRWMRIGLTLDCRAKVYSRVEKPKGRGREGLFCFHQFFELEHQDRSLPRPGQWEWVFAPLAKELLEHFCDWLVVGHFVGDSEAPERRWLYGLSERLSLGEPGCATARGRQLAFGRALRCLSLNASFPRFSRGVITLSSALMEQCLDGDLLPPGSFLVETLRSEGDVMPVQLAERPGLNDRYIHIDLSEETLQSEADEEKCTARRRILDSTLPSMDTILDQCDRALTADRLLPLSFLWQDDGLAAVQDATDHYGAKLKELFPDQYRLDARRDNWTYPAYQTVLRDALSEPGEEARIARYAAWMADVSPDTTAVLTIPAWLPGKGESGRSGALIAALRRGVRVTHAEVLAIVSAFRLGCVNVPVEQARADSSAEAAYRALHTIGHAQKAPFFDMMEAAAAIAETVQRNSPGDADALEAVDTIRSGLDEAGGLAMMGGFLSEPEAQTSSRHKYWWQPTDTDLHGLTISADGLRELLRRRLNYAKRYPRGTWGTPDWDRLRLELSWDLPSQFYWLAFTLPGNEEVSASSIPAAAAKAVLNEVLINSVRNNDPERPHVAVIARRVQKDGRSLFRLLVINRTVAGTSLLPSAGDLQSRADQYAHAGLQSIVQCLAAFKWHLHRQQHIPGDPSAGFDRLIELAGPSHEGDRTILGFTADDPLVVVGFDAHDPPAFSEGSADE